MSKLWSITIPKKNYDSMADLVPVKIWTDLTLGSTRDLKPLLSSIFGNNIASSRYFSRSNTLHLRINLGLTQEIRAKRLDRFLEVVREWAIQRIEEFVQLSRELIVYGLDVRTLVEILYNENPSIPPQNHQTALVALAKCLAAILPPDSTQATIVAAANYTDGIAPALHLDTVDGRRLNYRLSEV